MRASASRIWCAQPDHSCPTVSGTASIRWVRPVLTTSIHCLAFVSIAVASASACGSRCSSNSSTAAMCIAVGKVSFEDCPILTSSFGCTGDLLPILPAEQLDRPVRQHLVDVHVGLRAGAGLPDIEREMLVELAGDRLVGRAHDRVGLPLREPPGRGVDQGRRLFDIAIGVVDALWHAVVADREMYEAALGLRSPIAVGRHLDLAHRVGLAPRFRWRRCRSGRRGSWAELSRSLQSPSQASRGVSG